MEWISRIADVIKLPTKYFALMALVTGIILFSPDSLIRRLHMEAVPEKFGFWLGLLFLVSSGLVVVNSTSWLIKYTQARRWSTKRRMAIEEQLHKLDLVEQAVLREFVIGGCNTIRLPLDHPAVAGLISRGIITQVGSFGARMIPGMVFSFTISDGLKHLITPQVLGIGSYLIDNPDGNWIVNDDGKRWISQNRPAFVAEIQHQESLFGW